jgi:hypothetical protein
MLGSSSKKIVPVLLPYLESPNNFVKRCAVSALGTASRSCPVWDTKRLFDTMEQYGQPWPDVRDEAIGELFAGKPNEDVYALLLERNRHFQIAKLVAGGGREWFDRAVADAFHATLDAPVDPKRRSRQRFQYRP